MKEILLIAGLVAAPAAVSSRQAAPDAKINPVDPRLVRLQQYFGQRDCPLREAAADFLAASDQNDLDWRLLPSISMIESSGGKDYRNNNVFGWDSCKERFTSVQQGIHFVAAKLAQSDRYKGKNLDAKLKTYNPNPIYPHRVKAVMAALGPSDLAPGRSGLNSVRTNQKTWITSGAAIIVALAAAKLIFHLYTGRHYGYFVDELYYLACSDHLAWGYVDQPPLIALITKITRVLLGDSLAAIRFFPALAGAATVALTGFMARELGGRRFAQGFAALSVLAAPAFLGLDNLLSMNAFEPLFWMGCAFVLIRMINTGDRKLWLWFGVLAGVGLENKHSMLIFGFGLIAGLLLTEQRKLMRGPWLWIGGALAFADLLRPTCCGISSIISRSSSCRPISGAATATSICRRCSFSSRRS